VNRRATLAFVAAAPIVVATLGVLWFAWHEVAGETPWSIGRPRNVAEAAGLGVGSEILRLLRDGQDPHRVWPVHRDVISSAVTRVTAPEAAVWSHKAQVMDLLERQGVLSRPDVRQHVLCLARDLQVGEIVDYLEGKGPAAPCVPGEALASVRARQPVQ
jgi:hypothetical protein